MSSAYQQKIFVRHRGALCVIVASASPWCLAGVSWCLLMSSELAVFLLDAARFAPDLSGLYKIHPIPNNHFWVFFFQMQVMLLSNKQRWIERDG